MTPSPESITQLLIEWRDGDEKALDRLIPLVYDELNRLAHRYMRRERPGRVPRAQDARLGLIQRPAHVLAGHATKPTYFAATRELLIGAEDGFIYRLPRK